MIDSRNGGIKSLPFSLEIVCKTIIMKLICRLLFQKVVGFELRASSLLDRYSTA
jgi:hypothetical protein